MKDIRKGIYIVNEHFPLFSSIDADALKETLIALADDAEGKEVSQLSPKAKEVYNTVIGEVHSLQEKYIRARTSHMKEVK